MDFGAAPLSMLSGMRKINSGIYDSYLYSVPKHSFSVNIDNINVGTWGPRATRKKLTARYCVKTIDVQREGFDL